MLSSFGLYWDSYSQLTSETGLLHLTYRVSDAFPLGDTFMVVASFSLFASFLSPAMFWICNHLFWDLWFAIPDAIRPGQDTSAWSRRFSESVSTHRLKLWALKSNSSIAMSLVKEKESADEEIQKNRPHPFLLVLCIGINYFFVPDGILRLAERALPVDVGYYFFGSLLAFSVLLLYIAFAAIPDDAGYIYLPGLKEHIGEQRKG